MSPLLSRLTAQVHGNNRMLLFTISGSKRIGVFFFGGRNVPRNKLTSHRMITCIPCASIQADGGCVSSRRDLLEGDPDIGTRTQQIHCPAQLCSLLRYVPCCVFPDQISGAAHLCKCLRAFEALIFNGRPQISLNLFPWIKKSLQFTHVVLHMVWKWFRFYECGAISS